MWKRLTLRGVATEDYSERCLDLELYINPFTTGVAQKMRKRKRKFTRYPINKKLRNQWVSIINKQGET